MCVMLLFRSYRHRIHAFWCLQRKSKLEHWSLVYILQQKQNTLIYTHLTDTKMQGHGVYKLRKFCPV